MRIYYNTYDSILIFSKVGVQTRRAPLSYFLPSRLSFYHLKSLVMTVCYATLKINRSFFCILLTGVRLLHLQHVVLHIKQHANTGSHSEWTTSGDMLKSRTFIFNLRFSQNIFTCRMAVLNIDCPNVFSYCPQPTMLCLLWPILHFFCALQALYSDVVNQFILEWE